ncbi:MAG: hypothetical protein N3D84_01290 [Candidatus Woesearchaeota archaeon]|nr:hypothetical protein [Candidatus Woesearchaeota archaeon]
MKEKYSNQYFNQNPLKKVEEQFYDALFYFETCVIEIPPECVKIEEGIERAFACVPTKKEGLYNKKRELNFDLFYIKNNGNINAVVVDREGNPEIRPMGASQAR